MRVEPRFDGVGQRLARDASKVGRHAAVVVERVAEILPSAIEVPRRAPEKGDQGDRRERQLAKHQCFRFVGTVTGAPWPASGGIKLNRPPADVVAEAGFTVGAAPRRIGGATPEHAGLARVPAAPERITAGVVGAAVVRATGRAAAIGFVAARSAAAHPTIRRVTTLAVQATGALTTDAALVALREWALA
jgi:hypothetical protein